MKTFKTVKAHIEEKRKIASTECDCCGRSVESELDSPNWEPPCFGWITRTAGLYSRYTDDQCSDYESIDICDTCANWLMGQIRAKAIRRDKNV